VKPTIRIPTKTEATTTTTAARATTATTKMTAPNRVGCVWPVWEAPEAGGDSVHQDLLGLHGYAQVLGQVQRHHWQWEWALYKIQCMVGRQLGLGLHGAEEVDTWSSARGRLLTEVAKVLRH
jgi:hypothetical protein